MSAPEVAKRYAGILLDAAEETGVSDPVRQDLEGLLRTLDSAADLSSCVADPLIGPEVKSRIVEQIFRGRVQELTLNFLLLLSSRRRINLLREILDACMRLFDERAGVVEAEVRATRELSDEQRTRLAERLSAYTGKKVRLRSRIDAKVRGGVIAQIGDLVFDGSLSTHLQRLRRQLSSTVGN